jgi:hypothetical protein
VRVIAISIGGWDHHTNLVAQRAALGAELSGCLKAFHDDLGSDLGRTLTLVMTEFGRRIEENGGDGTDHGHGGVMMAMGAGIAGGRVIVKDGVWPGLAPADRFIGENLQVTTDFRDVFAEALNRHMGLAVSSMGPVFPGLLGEHHEVPRTLRVAVRARCWPGVQELKGRSRYARLIAAMAEIAGSAWRPEYGRAWGVAFGIVAGAMLEGARAVEDEARVSVAG